MAPFSLLNKNILVTGASSGIGECCCKICSETGANLILIGRHQEKLSQALKQLHTGKHSYILCDLLNISDIEKSLNETLNRYGKIHGFIHSAGIDMTLPLNSLRSTNYQQVFNTNVISGFEISRILSKKQYCPDEGASYIFIASVMGIVGESAKVAYSATKGALISGCRSMALEFSQKKIRVNCISPGIVLTDLARNLFAELPEGAIDRIKSLHPLGFGSPVDVANACVFLLSDETKWITGSNLVIDGGYSIH